MHKQSYKAYATATQTVAKTKQVVMLYEAAVKDMQQAIDAINAGDIQTRFNSLERAGNIVFGLQGALDFESAPDIAQVLYDYYASIDARIMSLHRTQDIAVCEQVLRDLKMMRDAWIEIDKMDEEGKIEAPTPQEKPAEAKPSSTENNPSPTDGGVAISA